MNDLPGTVDTAVVSARGLTKVYRQGDEDLIVLKDATFDVRAGESVAIIGPSGSGKTTLLQLMGGLDEPTSGEVQWTGRGIGSMSAKQLGIARNETIGFVFQSHHLLPEFSALENVTIPSVIAGLSLSEAKDRANQLLVQVGLESRVRHKPGELSGGERQRAAIARALASNPKCILADEPTGNLDEDNADRVFDLLTEMANSASMALVVVTHDAERAARMSRTLRVQDGHLHST